MKDKKIVYIAAIVAAALLLFYVSSLKSQLIEACILQENYKTKISNLSAVNESAALQTNRAFL